MRSAVLDLPSQPVRNLVRAPIPRTAASPSATSGLPSVGWGAYAPGISYTSDVTTGPFRGVVTTFARWTCTGGSNLASAWYCICGAGSVDTPVEPGRTYTAIISGRASWATNTRIIVEFWGPAGFVTSVQGPLVAHAAEEVREFRVTFTARAGSTYVKIIFARDTGANPIVGNYLDASMAMLVEGGGYTGPWCTGDTPGWRWISEANGSQSAGYPYTLESIVGPLLFDYTAPGTYTLDPAAWNPAVNGIMLLAVTDLLSIPGPGVPDIIAAYGSYGGASFTDNTPPNNFATRWIGDASTPAATVQTRVTAGAAASRFTVVTSPGRYVTAGGLAPGGGLLAGISTVPALGTGTPPATGTTHDRIWIPPANATHWPVRVVGIRPTDTATVQRAMAWLTQVHGTEIVPPALLSAGTHATTSWDYTLVAGDHTTPTGYYFVGGGA